MDLKETFTVTPGERSTMVIAGEIPFAELEQERAAAVKKLGANVQADGFRPGHVPEKVVVERVGEMAIISEMAERALGRIFPEILKAHKIDAIGYPQISVTKLAPDNPFAFTATVAVLPEIQLPDYTAIAKPLNAEKPSADVTDEDVEKQIKDILRQKVAYERLQQKAQQKEAASATDPTELPTPESEAQKQADDAPTEPGEVTDSELPPLTDELVKTLGQPGQFESVEDFKTKLREHLTIEKQREAASAHRGKITDAIIEQSELTLPEILVDSEIQQMFAQMEEDLSRMNLKLDDYLGHIKKTREELKEEWTPAAEKRAKTQLILNEIARKENIEPDPEAVATSVAQLKEQHPDADPARITVYVESVLRNDRVMETLESK